MRSNRAFPARARARQQLHAALAAAALLCLMAALALGSMVQKAPTFDEQGFIVRGLAALRGYDQIRVGHPLGLNALNAAFLATDETVALPLDDPSWAGTSFHRPAELFLWEIGNDVSHIMFLARLPTIWLGVLMAALAGRWAGQLSGRRWAGLLALAFVALDPNVLAHTRLATTDLGLTAFALLAAYTLWRFLRRPSWSRALLAGAALGLLQSTKFTAALFVPLFALLIVIWFVSVWRAAARAPWAALGQLLVAYPLAALLALWAAHGFQFGTLPADLPILDQLGGLTLPLSGYLEQLLDIGGRLQVSTPSFLLGEYSEGGWWYYFPVAFLLKTPLPTLLLLVWGALAFALCLLRRRGRCPDLLDSAALLLPALGFFAIALTTDINLGYRHILPALPFIVIFAVTAVSRAIPRPTALPRLAPALALVLWLGAAALWLYPDYLAFFNLLAGGPDNGWRSLVDSNLDWGQDLDDLAPWLAEHGYDEVWLSYFGEARPEAYGIPYRGLDSFPPRLMDPAARPFYPADPAPGLYAISATNLQGVHFADHDQFAWFRDREPLDKLGYSIFLYDVPARGAPADLVLAGLQLDELPPALHARLGGNDVRPRWVDPSQALILPDGPFWWAQPQDAAPAPLFGAYLHGLFGDSSSLDGVQLSVGTPSALSVETLATFGQGDGRVRLQGVTSLPAPDGQVLVRSVWRQEGPPQPLQIFVHARDSEQNIVAQWDGLGATAAGWRAGDTLVQLAALPLSPQDLAGLDLAIGLYNPQTGERWLAEDGSDALTLPAMQTVEE